MNNLTTITLQPESTAAINNSSANQTLSFCEMWLDSIKAVKAHCDPLSDGVSCLAGTLCCVATAVAQAEDNSRPATRGDVLHAERHRRNDAAELGCAYATGACIGDTVIDTASISIGCFLGFFRASCLSLSGNNQKDNNVLGIPRETIDEVDLFSSCNQITNQFN